MGHLFVDQEGVLDDALQGEDAPLHEGLLVLGVVVLGVVLGAGELLRLLDTTGNLRSPDRHQQVQLLLYLG